MRKYLYAGAMVGGLLLSGAAPAYADVVPVPIGAQQQDGGGLSGLLGPDGGLSIDRPFGDGKVLDLDPGTNTPDLTPLAGAVLPEQNAVPAPVRITTRMAGSYRMPSRVRSNSPYIE